MRSLIITILLGNLDVQSGSTLKIQEGVDFKQLQQHVCGTDDKEANINKQFRTFTPMEKDRFWADAIVPWSFVQHVDGLSSVSVHTNSKVGLSRKDFETVKLAMKQIEWKTCIKFRLTKPVKGDPWLFITRDAHSSSLRCQHDYINNHLKGKDIAGLGHIYSKLDTSGDCFSGSYANYGESSPQILVISAHSLNAKQNDVGHIVHELLHVLGVGHTQKRQDANKTIEILWDNIESTAWSQYTPCDGDACSRYNEYGTKYDCMSIMHYRDRAFSKNGGRTMKPKKEGCDLSSSTNKLRTSDISLLNKMYCKNKADGTIKSPSFPENYPINVDVPFNLEVDPGSRIKLTFTSFHLEDHPYCKYDYVKVTDSDGTTELAKLCGSSIPSMIKSSGNKLTVAFHSDQSKTEKGFSAKWSKVSGLCTGGDCDFGTIKSTNYPENYPNDEHLPFNLEVDPGNRIELTFTSFDLEVGLDCRYDYVKVTDSDGTTELAKFCGSTIPSKIKSSANKLNVVFFSDKNVNEKGFLATWREVAGF